MDADAVITSDVDEFAAIDSDCGVELANKRIRLWYNGQKITRNLRKNHNAVPLNASRESISHGKDADDAQPLRRNLRTRKFAQLHPYTVEALQYRRELYQNDWQDAVVSQREWRHARRLEAERAAAAGGSALIPVDHGNDADSEFSADEVVSGSPSLGARSSDQEDHAESPITSPILSPLASTASRNTSQRPSNQRRRMRSEPESSSSTSASSSSSKTIRSVRKPSVYAVSDDEAKEHQLESSRSHPTLPDSDSSSGDSTDYERRFRILRRMMPAHMARACIDDLRAMRHGHAMPDEDSGATSPPPLTHRETATHHPDSPLRPGESRRRRGAQLSPHAPLLSDVDSSSETQSSVSSPLSPSRYEERDLRSWYKPQDSHEDTHTHHETDAVDRMLSRTTGSHGFGQRGAKRPLSRAKEGKVRSENVSPNDSAWLWKPFRNANDSREKLSGYISKTSRPAKQSVPAANESWLLSSPSSGTSQRRSKSASKSQTKSPSLFLVQGNSNFHTDFPTSRGDLRSNARLPYSPKAGDDEIDVLDSASLVQFPQKHLTMIPRSVPRRSRSIFSNESRQLPGANTLPSANENQPIPFLSSNTATIKAKPTTETSPEQIANRTTPKQPIQSYSVPLAEVPLSWQQATEESPELRDDLQHLLAFEKIRTISLDFDLKLPSPGSHFTSSSQIARGRLHALLRVDRDVQRESAPSCHLYGLTLRGWLTLNELQEALPPLLDDVWDSLQDFRQDEASPSSPSDPRASSGAQLTSLARVDDLFFFLTEWLSWQASQPIQLADLSRELGNGLLGEPTKSNIDAAAYGTRLVDLVYTSLDRESDHDAAQLAELRLCLLWFRVAIAYRVYLITNEVGTDLGVIEAAQPLMVHLLARGIHKTMASVCASQSDGINDRCAELWIGLIYVLDSVDHSFYDVLDAALDDWQVNAPVPPLIACERVWYMIFATSVLARFGAAAGVVRSSAAMPSSWMLIHRALSLQLRFDSRVEAAAPRALLRRRDAYLRTVLARCLLLVDRFAWSLHDADLVLGRLFDWLDTHKLGDLPTETDHDFAPFLRRYNLALLYEGPSGNAFQRFLQLLARVGNHLFEHDNQRQLARIFSRMTPVRIMPFSREHPPTSAERAMLFNHYSLVMLFLHFVPQSALQRLRQIRSFLEFPSADRISQITCIRAMVYCGTLFRHHNLCLAPIIAWFVDVCRASTKEVRMIPDRDDRRAVHRQKESVRVLLGVVRGVQHLVQHSSLNTKQCRQFPPPELLHAAWTNELLGIDGAIDAEVVQGLNAFLQQRAEIRLSVFQHTSSTYAMDVDFDDTDTMEDEALWADPRLAALLGETEAVSAASAASALEWDKDADRKLADTLHTRISPALFTRIAQPWPVPIAPGAFHQQGQVEALVANAERDANFHLLVSCWVACAEVLVQNEVRSWGSYLTLGTESWKRLPDPKQKRDVALQFSVLLAGIHPEGFRSEIWEVTGIWFQCIMAPQLSQQVHLTMQLITVNPGHLFDSVTLSAEPQVTVSLSRQTLGKESFATAYDPVAKEFAKHRSRCLGQVLENMNRLVSQAEPPFSLGFAIQCISALLSSLRAYAPIPNDEMYRRDVEKVFQQLSSMHAPLNRGISRELQSTMAVV